MRGRLWGWPTGLAWVGAWTFWMATTRRFHPSLLLAVIVTTALILAYAVAVYINHFALIPRYWRTGRRGGYLVRLVVVMVVLTAAALVVIRTSYLTLHGPDPDPYGVPRHFLIDLFGMAVHLAVAALIAWGVGRVGERA